MPRFAAIRNVLRGSKDTISPSTSASSLAATSAVTIEAADRISTSTNSRNPACYTTFSGLISLSEARRNPDIVYHSVRMIPDPTPAPEVDFPTPSYPLKLVPLAIAAARPEIKYRREGFEMLEARAHIAAVRADLF
ncbi:hypothetical protein PsYK624_141720 [Phanerochaete sordida]|uniref:Uncharacterized protein n=1 Tax=Phanerochaete sordida TaxID=48140 RepID=A0A9P3GR26_9APHY|nr:hypothetical protein PsYK624_141720 [Phanerochaete sordida]